MIRATEGWTKAYSLPFRRGSGIIPDVEFEIVQELGEGDGADLGGAAHGISAISG
jgi:hypothetical protein